MLQPAVIIVAVVIAAWSISLAWPRKSIDISSAVNGKAYAVRNQPDAQAVADRLAALELRIRDFLDRAERRAPGDPRLKNIRQRWNGTLSETTDDVDVAYSLDKGSIHVCVRRADGQMESENTSMFVLLHELAHIATDTYGHKAEFWANMRFLLELAEVTGSYTYENFDDQAVSYCGKPLRDSPLTCVKTGQCRSELRPGDPQ